MGTAAYAERNTTKGWVPIPNSIIENQSVLTHGELSLALVVLRRGGNAIPVSDRNWQAWTGLSPRLKEMAIKGLREKGLKVDGKGEAARFTWESQNWHHYLRHAPSQKPRTAGRQVDPKPTQKIHQECRDRGCAMLRADCASGGLSLVPATPVAQPVSQTSTNPHPSGKPEGYTESGTNQNRLNVLPATPIAKRVSQTESEWAKTMAALCGFFPAVAVAFLVRLLAAVKVLFADVHDSELARAVGYAFEQAGQRQTSAGLFLITVPEAVAALRRAKGARAAPIPDYSWPIDDDALEEARKILSDPANESNITLWESAQRAVKRAQKAKGLQ